MKIRLLTLLIVCLSLHTTKVFAHPKPDGMSESEHTAYHHRDIEALRRRLDRVEKIREVVREEIRDLKLWLMCLTVSIGVLTIAVMIRIVLKES
jgi:hypothetical protein